MLAMMLVGGSGAVRAAAERLDLFQGIRRPDIDTNVDAARLEACATSKAGQSTLSGKMV
jgi:hypothetical protein